MYSKKTFFGILAGAIVLLASCGGGKPNFKASLKNDVDSASYFLGYHFGVQFVHSDFDDINIKALAKGMQEAIKKGKEMDEEKMQEISMYLNSFFMNLQNRAMEKNRKEGQDFLEANKKKSGVVSLPSGLQYKIIREGTGIKPTMEDMVDVVYHGTLIDGKVFDSSKERGDTTNFSVGRVVPGFSEALTLMNEGSIWEVYIPSELGYGDRPQYGSPIKPNSVLIFEIDLVKVKKAAEEVKK